MGHNYYGEPAWPNDLLYIFPVVILGTIACNVGLAVLDHPWLGNPRILLQLFWKYYLNGIFFPYFKYFVHGNSSVANTPQLPLQHTIKLRITFTFLSIDCRGVKYSDLQFLHLLCTKSPFSTAKRLRRRCSVLGYQRCKRWTRCRARGSSKVGGGFEVQDFSVNGWRVEWV